MPPVTRSKKDQEEKSSSSRPSKKALKKVSKRTASKKSAKPSPKKKLQSKTQRPSKRRASVKGQNVSLAGGESSVSETTVPSTDGLCFQEAIDAMKGGNISQEEYFGYLVKHYQGIRHKIDLDSFNRLLDGLALTEPVATAIYQSAIKGNYEKFSEAEVDTCRKLFHVCAEGDLHQFRTIFQELSSRRSLLLKPIARLAATKPDVEIFQDCLLFSMETGVNINLELNEIVFRVPKVLDFLLEHNWNNIQNSPKALNDGLIYQSLIQHKGQSLEVLRWLLDHGARIPGREWQMMATGPPPLDVVKFLLV
jgi:hypothetical protein